MTVSGATQEARSITPRSEKCREAIYKVAVLTDFPEEGWRSMDLCGDMLLEHLPRQGAFGLEPFRLCPRFRRLATRLPALVGVGPRSTPIGCSIGSSSFLYTRGGRSISSTVSMLSIILMASS